MYIQKCAHFNRPTATIFQLFPLLSSLCYAFMPRNTFDNNFSSLCIYPLILQGLYVYIHTYIQHRMCNEDKKEQSDVYVCNKTYEHCYCTYDCSQCMKTIWNNEIKQKRIREHRVTSQEWKWKLHSESRCIFSCFFFFIIIIIIIVSSFIAFHLVWN